VTSVNKPRRAVSAGHAEPPRGHEAQASRSDESVHATSGNREPTDRSDFVYVARNAFLATATCLARSRAIPRIFGLVKKPKDPNGVKADRKVSHAGVGSPPAFRVASRRRAESKCRRAPALRGAFDRRPVRRAARHGRAGVFFAAQPVDVALQGNDLGVVDQPVDHRGGGHVVAEDLSRPNCSWHRLGRWLTRVAALFLLSGRVHSFQGVGSGCEALPSSLRRCGGVRVWDSEGFRWCRARAGSLELRP
jgi:hypothetical protein